MNQKTYKIRIAITLPLALIALCLLLVSLVALFSSSSAAERILLPGLFVLTLLFSLENLTRTVSVGETGLRLVKFFRTKDLPWNDINHVAGLNLKSKLYLLLTTNRGFFFISNNMERFEDLSSDIISGVGGERVEPEVQALVNRPARFSWPLLYFWGAALLVLLLTFFRLTHL